jgi:hypothetical protein
MKNKLMVGRIGNALLAMVFATSLTACGGIGGATISGTMTGLATGATVVLENTGNNDTLSVTANGTFKFADGAKAGDAYNVTVLTQPAGQTCTPVNSAGTVDTAGDDVANIVISCATSSSLGGTVTGLGTGRSLVLANNGVQVNIVADGSFSFPGILAANSTFSVTVVTQPSGLTCTLANATGTITANVVSLVTVTCG